MLVLQRKVQESLTITIPYGIQIPKEGLKIEVVLTGIKGLNKARIGIEADQQITILRSELEGSKPNDGE